MRLSLLNLRRHPVLVCGVLPPDAAARLERFFDLDIMPVEAVDNVLGFARRLEGKSALLAVATNRIDGALLRANPMLKAICKMVPDYCNIDLDACTRARVIVTNTPDFGSGAVAAAGMAEAAAGNLMAAFGFGRIGGAPKNLLNLDLRCMLGCCGW